MPAPHRLRPLCAATFLAVATGFAADAPKEQPAPSAPTATPPPAPAAIPAAAAPADDHAVKLPVFPVSASRLREIDLKIKKLEKQITREKTLLEKSALDDTLNDEKISKAANLFGGKSAAQRESLAAVRVESMEKELDLLGKLRTPMTKDDRELVEKLIEDQRTYRRNLDDALR